MLEILEAVLPLLHPNLGPFILSPPTTLQASSVLKNPIFFFESQSHLMSNWRISNIPNGHGCAAEVLKLKALDKRLLSVPIPSCKSQG